VEEGKFVEMFKPIRLGRVEIKNRFSMAPMCNGFVDHGSITQQYISYFAARARGGVGAIVSTPAMAYTGGSKLHVQNPNLHDRADIGRWNEFVETIHSFDCKVIIQAMSGSAGRQVPRGVPTKAPSAIPLRIKPENLPRKEEEFRVRRGLWPTNWDKFYGVEPPVELTIEEIKQIEDVWANQALLCKQTGADAVEFHFAHGYLAHNFMSPRENLRRDEYGGSFDNRIRLCINILRKARVLVGPNFTIGARLAGTDRLPGGLGVHEMAKIIKRFEDCGLDFVDMSEGCYEAANYLFPDEDGTMIPTAAELKREGVTIPIICANIHDPHIGEKALKEGKINMIGLGRPLLADPEYVNKCAREGIKVKHRKCIRCLICDRRIRNDLGIRCEVNREVGLEWCEPKNWPINGPKKKEFFYATDY